VNAYGSVGWGRSEITSAQARRKLYFLTQSLKENTGTVIKWDIFTRETAKYDIKMEMM
jgi:hypothetical protein